MVGLTIDVDNGVFGATPITTQGYFRACRTIEESNESRLYVAVEREIDGNTALFFERDVSREYVRLEEAFCVDAGAKLAKTAPAGKLIPTTLTGAVTFTTTGGTPFVSGDVGKIIRCGSGQATISGYTSSSEVNGTWTRDLEETIPETTTPARFASGDWWMDSTTTTLSNIWWLPSTAVTVLGDGAVDSDETVSSEGVVTLETAISRAAVGLSYTCVAKSLPLTARDAVVEHRRKDITSIGLRLFDTYGLKHGPTETDLYALADRPQRLWSGSYADRLRQAYIEEPVKVDWDEDAQVFLVQDSPRPAAILALVRSVELGDDR